MAERNEQTGFSLVDLFPDLAAGLPEVFVRDMTTDSRRAVAGGLFLACPGVNGHGLEYLPEALEAGVSAVAWEPANGVAAPELPAQVHGLEVPHLGERVGALADRFFGQPSAALRVTGITGTNGKTTTAWLASEALDRLDGSTAYMGTLGYGRLPQLQPSSLTTPGVISVHRRMHELVNDGVGNLVMEVSSHGLDQGRIDGVRIRTAAFTNLSRDHLDYHADLDAYKRAKARLFEVDGLETAVINIGDEFGMELVRRLAGDVGLITVAMADAIGPGIEADISARCETLGAEGLRIEFSGAHGSATLHSRLWGSFNAENLLVAVGILIAQGFSLDEALAALDAGSVPPGRMQVIAAGANQPAVIVDFAHTPDALERALDGIRRHTGGRLICVFGCGGDRDQGKRGEMGAIAGRLADYTILTSDNPRSEDPLAIIHDIVAGITDDGSYVIEADRRAAITAAIAGAASEDTVLIAGKGAEEYQLISDRVDAFSDAEVARAALEGRA
jgi:UDP-N-acetylmuramoyl-L-alanyl-D-glutamate--2,6-diaminopimelate ligase